MDVSEFGSFIKTLRQRKGLTLSKLAEVSGVSHPYLSQIENGKIKNFPSPEVLIKLAKPLGVSFAQLMYQAGYIDDYDFLTDDDEVVNQLVRKGVINETLKPVLDNDVKEITTYLKQPDITYHGRLLSDDDKQRILAMLKVLFPEREGK